MRFVLTLSCCLVLAACDEEAIPLAGAGADSAADTTSGGDTAVDADHDAPLADTPSDPAVSDVSEAFCACDDDCAPLGDGSLCNGTVCTFGVAGIPCSDVGADTDSDTELGDAATDAPADTLADIAADTPADTAADAPGDTADTPADTAADAPGDTAVEDALDAPDAPATQGIDSLVLDSGGGFTGRGTRDISIAGGEMSVTDPFGGSCAAPMSGDQITRLNTAADAVGWAGIVAGYFPAENPTCCCDQYGYDLRLTLLGAEGSSATFSTSWCDQSRAEGLLPVPLSDFIDALNAVADAIMGACPD